MAFKRDGFCSKHEGAEHIQSLQEDNALGPVFEYFIFYWKKKLHFAQRNYQNSYDEGSKKVIDVLTSAVVGMLLEFYELSESLIRSVSRTICSEEDLLYLLLRAVIFLSDKVGENLVELLLKLCSDPSYKFEFAKVFLKYYLEVVNKAVHECKDYIIEMDLAVLQMFSVQVFTVPGIIKETDLLTMLLDCLTNILSFCSGEHPPLLQVNLPSTYICVIFSFHSLCLIDDFFSGIHVWKNA